MNTVKERLDFRGHLDIDVQCLFVSQPKYKKHLVKVINIMIVIRLARFFYKTIYILKTGSGSDLIFKTRS